MLKKILLFCFIYFLVWQVAYGQETIRVAIYPFQINSREDLTYLSEEILDKLISCMEEDERFFVIGKSVVRSELESISEEGLDDAFAKNVGAKLGADFVIRGSFTKIGEYISLDVKVLEIEGDSLPSRFYVDGRGLDRLTNLVGEFPRRIGPKLLGEEVIIKISVSGNSRIEDDAIKSQIKSREGDFLSPKALGEDLKRVYEMGYFDDVKLVKGDMAAGKEVTFIVSETPFIKGIEINGNKFIRKEDIEEVIDIKPNTILNFNRIRTNVKNITKLYKERGYWTAEVDYKLYYLKTKEVIVAFTVEEKEKTKIRHIEFVGNQTYDDEELQDIIETSKKGFFSWLTDSGVLREEVLDQDTDRIRAFYSINGYIEAKVGKPEINLEEKGIFITVPIDEGKQFSVGRVEMRGDLIQEKDVLQKGLKTIEGEIFNRKSLREDVVNLTDKYAEFGYAFADITPLTSVNKEEHLVHVAFDVSKGKKVYFERITITGNNRTRDQVIRRELKVAAGELYDKAKLGMSYEKVNRLGYFEEVNFNTAKGSGDDKLNLNIRVKERPTGSISAGLGYSSVDDLIAMCNLSESNLLGRGQKLSLAAKLGGKSTSYNLGFTEPWLFYTPISAGFDIYDVEREYTDYDQYAKGGAIRLGFPITEDYTRLYLRYRHEKVKISNVYEGSVLKEEEGTSTTNGFRISLVRDSRDSVIFATKGSKNSVAVEYAGGPLGGTNYFTKYTAGTTWYFPLMWDTVFMCRGVIGYVHGNESRDVPLFERFFLGGINSIRGFENYSVGPKDPITDDAVGGTQQILFNIEFIFPLIKEAGVKGVVFYDAGNAFNKKGDAPFYSDEETTTIVPYGDIFRFDIPRLRTAVGGGIRWYSPMGPLRLEWGYNLDPEQDEKRSNWEFTIGVTF